MLPSNQVSGGVGGYPGAVRMAGTPQQAISVRPGGPVHVQGAYPTAIGTVFPYGPGTSGAGGSGAPVMFLPNGRGGPAPVVYSQQKPLTDYDLARRIAGGVGGSGAPGGAPSGGGADKDHALAMQLQQQFDDEAAGRRKPAQINYPSTSKPTKSQIDADAELARKLQEEDG